MEILENFNLSLSADDILRGEGADPEIVHTRKPALLKAACSAMSNGFNKLHPVAVIQTIKVAEHRHEQVLLTDNKKVTGPLVAHHLAGAESVTAVVCTIGSELEKYASSLDDTILTLALDGLGNAAVEAVAQQVCTRIREQAQWCGLTTSAPLSPGEPDWPVEVGQPQVFSLVDPSQAGITLTTGGMMVPKKSLSFVVGLGPEMAQTKLCVLCSLSEKCSYRHV